MGRPAVPDDDRAGRPDGLTIGEGAVMDALVSAWNAYAALPAQHPADQAEFRHGIHRCQDLLAVRIARRHFPKGWVIQS